MQVEMRNFNADHLVIGIFRDCAFGKSNITWDVGQIIKWVGLVAINRDVCGVSNDRHVPVEPERSSIIHYELLVHENLAQVIIF